MVLYALNEGCISKLQPREGDVPTNPNRAHDFGTSSPSFWFLDVLGFPLFLNIKKAYEPHCNTVQRNVDATSLLKEKLTSSELVYFHSTCKQFQYFIINEWKFNFCCSFMFLFKSIFNFLLVEIWINM